MNEVQIRRRQIHEILGDPPPVHGGAAPSGVWGTMPDCYEFLAEHVSAGARTLETGCGISTALFAVWRAHHTCVSYFRSEIDILESWARERGTDLSQMRFEVGPSDEVLPRLEPTELDLVFIDGGHGFPTAIVDWFYAAGRLGEGGIVVLDDVQLRSVTLGLFEFLARDPRWEPVACTHKWAAFVRHDSGPLRADWDRQPFIN